MNLDGTSTSKQLETLLARVPDDHPDDDRDGNNSADEKEEDNSKIVEYFDN